MSMVDESPRYYIKNGNFYHYTPSNLYLSAGFYTGTDAIRESLGDIHRNKEKMYELIENGYEIYDYDKKKWIEIEDIEILEKDKENLEQSGIEMGKHILSFIDSLTECQQVSPVDGDELGKEVERLYSIYHFNAPIGETRFIAKYFANWKLEKALGIADKAYFESCAKIRQQTIDKAAEWLSELDDALFLGYDNDGYPYIDRDGLARDFKKYMEY